MSFGKRAASPSGPASLARPDAREPALRTLASILALALSLFTPEFLMAAGVPHPALPEGAGPIDAAAPHAPLPG